MSDSPTEPEGPSTGPEQRPDGGTIGEQTGRPEQVEAAEEMDWHGWILVGAVVVSFLVMPVLILFLPQMSSLIGSLGFSLRQAYLVFPMIPAIMLGTIAVWAALRTQVK